MRKYLITLISVAAVLAARSVFALEFSFDNFMAGTSYSENDTYDNTEVRTSWTSFMYKGNLALSKYDSRDLQGEAFYGMSFAPKSKEKVYISGSLDVTDDMSFWGFDTGLALGWAFPVELPEQMEISLTPLIGYRWKFTRYSRTNILAEGMPTIVDVIDMDYHVQSLDLGGRLNFKVNDKLNVFVKPIFGIVLINNEKNSESGRVDGHGGVIFNLDAGLNYLVLNNFMVEGAFRAEVQKLNGSEFNNKIWPDNLTQSYGGTVSAKYVF